MDHQPGHCENAQMYLQTLEIIRRFFSMFLYACIYREWNVLGKISILPRVFLNAEKQTEFVENILIVDKVKIMTKKRKQED